ncbi:hypothetical protein D1007_02962 [Hordeum vulgare]|nr:hypothetical protein D1007_02962 [Hordeum vulgare]
MWTDLSLQELEHLSPHLFAWHWLPSSGTTVHSGGILLEVKDATFEICSTDRDEFYISMEVYEGGINFKWEIVVVYGPSDHRRSESFLVDLRRTISSAPLPVVVGGDFNLICYAAHKSNDRLNFPRMQLLNDCIADLGLCELDRVGARFTWTNRQTNPTLSVLDRVFVAQRAARDSPLRSVSAVDSWQLGAKLARQFMKCWGANLGRNLRERKRGLLESIQALDLQADSSGLSPDEWLLNYDLEDHLSVIYTNEEAFWHQRDTQHWVLRGDSNTAYFQAIPNGRCGATPFPSCGMRRPSSSSVLRSALTSMASTKPFSHPPLGEGCFWPRPFGTLTNSSLMMRASP